MCFKKSYWDLMPIKVCVCFFLFFFQGRITGQISTGHITLSTEKLDTQKQKTTNQTKH